jgi:hypothetical protein
MSKVGNSNGANANLEDRVGRLVRGQFVVGVLVE